MSVPTSKNGSSLSSSFQNESGNRESFHFRLKRKRKELDISQQKLADMIGVTKNTIQSWERSTFPKGDHLITLSTIFSCSTDWLLKGENDTNGSQVAYIDYATQLVYEVEKEVKTKLNDSQRKAVVEILRKEIDRRNQESKDQIAKLLTSFIVRD
ncbi:helix-turn-helix domain-containing protein [Desulfosarcina widdelii]|uniref:helix-turn-helix domain-containing protein n=1 Tax=Desulfosarcina widdelii TaxID=947919 RepID=UPI0012D2F1C9|nr:helix-turn-helix domain-containing protein [Desulfosarcina widdelii]